MSGISGISGTRKSVPWLVALVVVAAAGAAYWRYRVTHRVPDVQYRSAPAELRRISAKVTTSGTLSALVTVQVGTQVSGRIQKLFADFNSPVTKGQLVAKIDPQLFEASVQQAQANYLSAKAGVATAEANAINADKQFARTTALHDQNLAAQADLDTAEAAVATSHAAIDAAKASVAQALASLHQAEVNLSYTNIMSPIDGVVISRSVDVGQTVAASLSAPVLFTIAQDLTKMQVDTNVAEGDVGRLQVDMKTFFTVDSFPGQRFAGKIRQIRNSATIVQNVVTYDAVIDVDNKDLRLRPGMTANVIVVYAERPRTLAVSNAALRFRPPPSLAGSAATGDESRRRPHGAASAAAADAPETRTIWVLRGGVPQPVPIHAGLTDGTVTEVVDGDLHEGDQVVTDSISADAPPVSSGAGGGSPALRRMF
jgi:HlyD family secretion protein